MQVAAKNANANQSVCLGLCVFDLWDRLEGDLMSPIPVCADDHNGVSRIAIPQ
jgi:hypothetical protein